MGKIFRFRRRGRWTRPAAYGVKPARFRKPRRAPARQGTWAQAWTAMRPWLFLIALVTLSAIYQLPGFYEPPAFMQGDPTVVDGNFTRCGPGRGHLCVIDGDTFKIGAAKYRVTGIDTAEVDAACPAEAAQAEASTAALQRWLNRGAFRVTTRIDEPTDRYGRTLAIVKRDAPGGGEDRLADFMQAEGGARRYDGGFRSGWC